MSSKLKNPATQISPPAASSQPKVRKTQEPKVRSTLVRWLLIMVVGVLAYGFGLWKGHEFKSERDQDRQMASVGGTVSIQSSTETPKSHSESR